MKKIFITIIVSLYCANICAKQSPSTESKPVNFIAQIENIDFNKTAISSDLKLLLADRYYFKDKTPCNTNTLSARAESMGLTTEEYINKIRSLRPAILDDRYFYLTVDQCDAGGTPMLTGIELCTEALCGAEYMKRSSDLWLDDELQPMVKRQATTVVHMPLPYDKEKKLWKVTGLYLESSEETGEVMQSKQIAFEGYTNEENFANRQRVSVFKSFYESGNLKSIYHYNAQNKRDGKAETYFDEKDKIAETLTFKDGQPEGEYIVYHENGAVESKRYFAQGKIKDGECPHFYDNGVLKQKHSYLNQKLEGPAFEYFPDGKIKGNIHTVKAPLSAPVRNIILPVKFVVFTTEITKVKTTERSNNTVKRANSFLKRPIKMANSFLLRAGMKMGIPKKNPLLIVKAVNMVRSKNGSATESLPHPKCINMMC